MDPIFEHFVNGFERALAGRNGGGRRIGAELKFPLVQPDGRAVPLVTVDALWAYLVDRGWRADRDGLTGRVVGARRPGEQNDTVASCETGYCKPEFSLAHVANLFELDAAIAQLRAELHPFCEANGVFFLGCGVHPVSRPTDKLLMKKSRTNPWDRVFGSNRIIPKEHGDDVCLFTLNTASHVHVGVDRDDAVAAVNVLNGFAGAQIALTANSTVWRGEVDAQHKCVSEKFWDWWIPDSLRVGVPAKPFEDLAAYVDTISGFKPVYVMRDERPVVLPGYPSFGHYYRSGEATGLDTDGRQVTLEPEAADIDLHWTCYWYNARLSRYYTVENRPNDQQPPEDLTTIAALTLGLVSALPEAREVLDGHDWLQLREAREAACRSGLAGRVGSLELSELAADMLSVARLGLESRRLGEEAFLDRLDRRIEEGSCPADEARALFEDGGVEALIAARAI